MQQQELFRRGRPKRPRGCGPLKAGERSLKYLRADGYEAEVAEKYIARFEGKGENQRGGFRGGYRRDLFGFVDILAYHPCRPDVLAVQTTSQAQVRPHLRHYREDPELAERIIAWLRQPGRRLVIHGWYPTRERTAKGAEVLRWRVDVREVTLEDFAQ